MTEEMTTVAPEVSENAQPSMEQTEVTTLESTTPEAWYSSLGEGLADNPSIQKFEDVNGLAKSYTELQGMLGSEKIPIPKGNEDTAAWDMYRKAFNVPDNHEEYEIAADEEMGDLSQFKEVMHKYNISQEVAQGLFNEYIGGLKEAGNMTSQQFMAEAQAAEASLRNEWGIKYDENISKARNYLTKVAGSKEEFDYYNDRVGNDPKFIKLFSKMGESISEGELGGFENQTSGFASTKAEAKAEYDKIMSDSSDPFWAGSKNKRNDIKYCKDNNLEYVSDEARKARVKHVHSLMQAMGQG